MSKMAYYKCLSESMETQGTVQIKIIFWSKPFPIYKSNIYSHDFNIISLISQNQPRSLEIVQPLEGRTLSVHCVFPISIFLFRVEANLRMCWCSYPFRPVCIGNPRVSVVAGWPGLIECSTANLPLLLCHSDT